MKVRLILLLLVSSQWLFAESLPVIYLQPTNETIFPGATATMIVSAEPAKSYQWRYDGEDIPGATNAALQVTNAQTTNSGYYMAIVKNDVGWVPSQMAYLSLDYTYGGTVPSGAGMMPFSNAGFTYFDGQIDYAQDSDYLVEDDTVQVVAGPELDQMQAVGLVLDYGIDAENFYFEPLYYFTNGYFNGPPQSLDTVAPGQTVYYSILVGYTDTFGYAITQPSTILTLNAGTNALTAPSANGLKFPDWPEWPEPDLNISPATNQLLVPGETVNFVNQYGAYDDFGIPTIQWRKDGENIPNATNFTYSGYGGTTVFTLTNLQASDAGVYDTIIYGNDWEVSPRIYVSIQTVNGQGIFQNSGFNGTNFVLNLSGAAGRNYDLQWSSNLVNWIDLVTLSNITGSVTFTNSSTLGNAQFYRTQLLPPP